MANDKFSISEALKYGWETFKSNVLFFLGLLAVLALIGVVPDFIAGKILQPESGGLILVQLFLRLVTLVLEMAVTRIALDAHDSGEPDLSRVKTIVPQIPSYITGKVVYILLVMITALPLLIWLYASRSMNGLIAAAVSFVLLFPVMIVTYMFLFVGYLIIDRNLGVLEGGNPIQWVVQIFRGSLEAMAESRSITEGYKMDLLWFSLVTAFLNIPGLILMALGNVYQISALKVSGVILLLPLIATIPLTFMASAYVYRRLSPAAEGVTEAPAA